MAISEGVVERLETGDGGGAGPPARSIVPLAELIGTLRLPRFGEEHTEYSSRREEMADDALLRILISIISIYDLES
jgi:hypothetical protein